MAHEVEVRRQPQRVRKSQVGIKPGPCKLLPRTAGFSMYDAHERAARFLIGGVIGLLIVLILISLVAS